MEIKFFKKGKVFKKKSFKLSPGIYWKIILSLFFILIITAAFFGYFIFSQINKDLMFSTDNSGRNGEKGKVEKVKDALDLFSKRAEKSNVILNAPVLVVDPSL
jgi:hypothetical protein